MIIIENGLDEPGCQNSGIDIVYKSYDLILPKSRIAGISGVLPAKNIFHTIFIHYPGIDNVKESYEFKKGRAQSLTFQHQIIRNLKNYWIFYCIPAFLNLIVL